MGDGEGVAAVEQREAVGVERRRRRIAVGAVGVEEEPALAVALEAAAIDDRDRDPPAVARGNHDPLGDIAARIVARGDALDLERLEPVLGRMVIVDGRRGDHRAVGEPIGGRRIFGIAAEPDRVGRLGEGDAPLGAVVGPQPDLVEAVDPLGDREMVAEGGDAAQIDLVRAGDHRVPVARMRGVRLGDAEIDVVVVGQDPQLAVARVDRILDQRPAPGDQHRRRLGIVGGDDADLVRAEFSPVEIRM